jgi:hypothetical protein
MMRGRHATNAAALACAVLVAALAGCAAQSPAHENQHFVPVTRTMQDWGALDFNNRQLQLEALEGEMRIEYVGALSESAGEDLAGAAVYRIKNADKYFEKNKAKSSFCSAPARFVALNSTTGAPAWSSEIWFALLTVDDWKAYAPGTGGSCGGGKYVRASAE